MFSLSAPAKLNLTLEVLGKRTDGYHEIRSVIQTISLEDSLSFRISDEFEFHSSSAGWDPAICLVSRAADLLATVTGARQRAAVTVTKRIPLLSGLGGDSSDAAATLLGLNRLWGLGLGDRELATLASRLGSDVPFFLYRGTALLSGRGDIIERLPPARHCWIVLALPPGARPPGKTRLLYESLKRSHFTDGEITRRLVEDIKSGRDIDASLLFNTFENVAFDTFPGLDAARQHVLKLGAARVLLAGSGPAFFTTFRDRAGAEALVAALHGQNLDTYLAETTAP